MDGSQPSAASAQSLYSVLGLTILATKQEIRQAYLRLCLRTHPDRGGSEAAFHRVQEAFEVLSHDELRAEYDLLFLLELHAEEYLRRYEDLALTPQGLGLGMQGRATKAC